MLFIKGFRAVKSPIFWAYLGVLGLKVIHSCGLEQTLKVCYNGSVIVKERKICHIKAEGSKRHI